MQPNQHDHAFKSSLSDLEVAQHFIENRLPQRLVTQLDLSALKTEKESFSGVLGARFADLLFSVPIVNTPGSWVYVLIEHKSYGDAQLAMQMASYQHQIWRQHERMKRRPRFPGIICLGYHHGERIYRHSMLPFSGLNDPLRVVSNAYREGFFLSDTNCMSNEVLLKEGWQSLIVYAQKNIHRDDTLAVLREMVPLFKEANRAGAGAYALGVLSYLVHSGDVSSHESLKVLIEDCFGEGSGEGIMSPWLAEKYEQGKAEGKAEGEEKTLHRVIPQLLKQGLSVPVISKIVGLPDKKVEVFSEAVAET